MAFSTDDTVRALLLLMPRLVGRAKRLGVPAALGGHDLAPRHLSLLAYLQFEGSLTVGELAERLEIAPTTVSLMVADLSRGGILVRREDDTDRRRRIVAIAPDQLAAVDAWLGGSAAAWRTALHGTSSAERETVVRVLRAYERALGEQG
ncbi:MarR family winged helix-turn-helix transcriptional regulator [Nocardia sp. NPDC003482]